MIDRLTPKQQGYRWPAEWEPHVGTLLSWPHNRNSWPDKFEPVPGVYKKLVTALSEVEDVHILAAAGDVLTQAEDLVGHLPNVSIHAIPTNDAWARDHGPSFLQAPKGQPWMAVDWNYNAWGGKYPPWDNDDAVPERLSEKLGFGRFQPGIVMEGGAVDGNGAGLVLSTTECLLNPNRNPHLSQAETEKFLCDYLCAEQILWLHRGIAGDDTDGHIDELARFVGLGTVVAAYEEDSSDENYEGLQQNFQDLQKMTDLNGQPLEVIPLHLPKAKYQDDQRLPASYCNFYIANEIVVVPQFGDDADEKACDTLQQCFPDRKMVPIDAIDLVWGLGAFHCISQQIMK
ncbi:agmatine deiminase family protein [Bremerella sp. JC817]|uniref:agmatine deiminase family protein n=1 Tax=Bremerella sp. JC817 TaxID=3231756 RepID=UPI0034580342